MAKQQQTRTDEQGQQVAVFQGERLPWHPAIEERFGIDRAGWRALTDAIWPAATSTDSVVLALSYCKARKLDPFKRPVHIVPVWSKDAGAMVDTVWPGIGELRTTAFRTGLYAGRDDAEFGPDITRNLRGIQITVPEWAKVVVHRICGGETRSFAGPKVYWQEIYSTAKRDTLAPNARWTKSPRGMLEKCAEAAALRAAFPEESGDDLIEEEVGSQESLIRSQTPAPRRADFKPNGGKPKAIDVPAEEQPKAKRQPKAKPGSLGLDDLT
jgi:phage recombination protein Bet